MKILHINDTYYELGGAEKYVLEISSAMEEMGHEVIIVSKSEGEHLTIQGRKEYFLRPSYGVRSGLRLWKVYRDILEKEEPDIIHLHNTQYFLSPLIIKKLSASKPTVKFVHDARFFCPNDGKKIVSVTKEICNYPVGTYCLNRKGCHLFPLNGKGRDPYFQFYKYLLVAYELRISKKLDRIIVPSQYIYDELVRNGFSNNRISKIPYYTEKAYGIGKKEEGEKGLILCIGRFDGVKGIPELIHALSYIKGRRWRAELVGEGPFRQKAEEEVERLGLKSRIKFLGQLSSKAIDGCFQRCSIIAIPSMIPESFGRVGIEAAAFEKPAVAFDSGGIREWLVEGETGFLVRRGDTQGLANRISQLLEDEELGSRMGRKGKERVDECFRKGQLLRRLLTVYEEVIRNRLNTSTR